MVETFRIAWALWEVLSRTLREVKGLLYLPEHVRLTAWKRCAEGKVRWAQYSPFWAQVYDEQIKLKRDSR